MDEGARQDLLQTLLEISSHEKSPILTLTVPKDFRDTPAATVCESFWTHVEKEQLCSIWREIRTTWRNEDFHEESFVELNLCATESGLLYRFQWTMWTKEPMPELVELDRWSGDCEDLEVAIMQVRKKCLTLLEKESWTSTQLFYAAGCLGIPFASQERALVVRLTRAICDCFDLKVLTEFLEKITQLKESMVD